MRYLLAVGLILLTACDHEIQPRGGSSEDEETGQNPEEPDWSRTPVPVERFLEGLGEMHVGGNIHVQTVVHEGRPYVRFIEREVEVRGDEEGEGKSTSTEEWKSGSFIGEDLDAPWFVYVHTSQELYAFDGRSQLQIVTRTVGEDGARNSAHKFVGGGEAWDPDPSLLETLPAKLIARIDSRQ